MPFRVGSTVGGVALTRGNPDQHVRHRPIGAVALDQRPPPVPAPAAALVAADGDGVGGVAGGGE